MGAWNAFTFYRNYRIRSPFFKSKAMIIGFTFVRVRTKENEKIFMILDGHVLVCILPAQNIQLLSGFHSFFDAGKFQCECVFVLYFMI